MGKWESEPVENSSHSSLSAKVPLSWVFLPHRGFMGPLNWEGTHGQPEACPAKRQSHTPRPCPESMPVCFQGGSGCTARHLGRMVGWAEPPELGSWLPIPSTPYSKRFCRQMAVTLTVQHVNALNLDLSFLPFQSSDSLYLPGKWVALEHSSWSWPWEMTVCCITPFNKPHFIQRKRKTFFVVCKLDINIVLTRKCWNLPTHPVMFRLLKIMLFLHTQTSVFTLLPI